MAPSSKLVSVVAALTVLAESSHAHQVIVGPGREHIELDHPHGPLKETQTSARAVAAGTPFTQDEWPAELQRPWARTAVHSQPMGSPLCLLTASD
jgi:hypothetical protein